MKRLGWLICLGFLAGVACGEPFDTTSGSGASSSNSANASGTGGGAASSTGSGGGACTPGVPSSCPGTGVYCSGADAAAPKCVACSDLSRLAFAKAIALPVTPPTSSATYPRMAFDSGDLYFTEENKGPPIRFGIVSAKKATKSMPTSPWDAWAPEPAPINIDANSSGALYVVDSSGLLNSVQSTIVTTGSNKPVLLWDSDRDTGKREIFVANPGATQPSLLQLNTSGMRDSRIAMAPATKRVWWMSDTGAVSTDRLVTAPLDKSTPVPVPLVLANGCHAASVDNPWVTPDGTLLFFDAVKPNAGGCNLPVGMLHYLFVAQLGSDGQQVANSQAQQIYPLEPLAYDVTPSLSSDMCYLLFSRLDLSSDATLEIAARE